MQQNKTYGSGTASNSGISPCTLTKWAFSVTFCLNDFEHNLHWNCGATPHSSFKCLVRLPLILYIRPHLFGQTYKPSSFTGYKYPPFIKLQFTDTLRKLELLETKVVAVLGVVEVPCITDVLDSQLKFDGCDPVIPRRRTYQLKPWMVQCRGKIAE